MTTTNETKAAEPLALVELNQRSAGLGAWEVGIYRPHIHDYKCTDKKNGQEKIGADFRAILVDVRDPSQYLIAHLSMRSDSKAPLKQAQEKSKPT